MTHLPLLACALLEQHAIHSQIILHASRHFLPSNGGCFMHPCVLNLLMLISQAAALQPCHLRERKGGTQAQLQAYLRRYHRAVWKVVTSKHALLRGFNVMVDVPSGLRCNHAHVPYHTQKLCSLSSKPSCDDSMSHTHYESENHHPATLDSNSFCFL
jgi:hypothetical protein